MKIMSKNDYILRHGPRTFVNKKCEILKKEFDKWNFYSSYEVIIGVDYPKNNQDPYVLHTPWIHAYCHINQLKIDTGKQSILTWASWGCQGKSNEFLVDTVFVVDEKFGWNGNEPNGEFKGKCPYNKSEGIYNDLLKYKNEKPNADRIYTAKPYKEGIQIQPDIRYEEYYSFIPLKYKNGHYELINILPVVKQNDSEFCKKMAPQNEAGVRNINYACSLLKYIYENANILVIKVIEDDSIEKVDEELQKKYFPLIYGIEYDRNIFKDCPIC